MKNKFIKSTLILILGGIITKLLSFIIRIYFTRVIGTDGINIYSIILPSYSLLITVTQLGFPIAIANIVAKGQRRGVKIMFSIIPVWLFLNIFLIIVVLVSGKFLAFNMLHNPDSYYPLISIAFVLPFISLSSIIRGYFFGKQQMLPHSLSNIIEQLFKLAVVLMVLPFLLRHGIIIAVCGYILISILSETISIVIFLLFLPKHFVIKKEDIKPDIETIKEVLSIGLPSVGSRIIGNIGYFLEPIVLSATLLFVGFSNKYIISQYAIYNSYVIAILIVPTFFISALSTALLPELSKYHHDKAKIKRILNKALNLSIIMGIVCNIGIYFLAETILTVLFHTSNGASYIKLMAFFFILYYLEGPMTSVLQALNETKYIMRTTTIGIIVKLSSIIIFGLLKTGIYSLIFAEIIYIFIVVLLNHYKINKLLKN